MLAEEDSITIRIYDYYYAFMQLVLGLLSYEAYPILSRQSESVEIFYYKR